MESPLIPTLSGIKRLSAALELRWQDDNLKFSLDFSELRYQCPCAHCVSEITGARIIKPDEVSSDIKLIDMPAVGNYAYRILFSDGHDSGIYPISYLHELCQNHE